MSDSTRERMDQIARAISENNQPGVIAPTVQAWQVTGLTVVANRLYVARFVSALAIDATMLSFVVSTAAGSNDNVDVGLYDQDFKKLVSTGPVAGMLNSTGAKNLYLPTRYLCQPGVPYYAAFACGAIGGTAAAVVGAQFASAFLPRMFGTTPGIVETEFQDSAHPLPNTITPGGGPTQVPAISVRRS